MWTLSNRPPKQMAGHPFGWHPSMISVNFCHFNSLAYAPRALWAKDVRSTALKKEVCPIK